MPRQIARGQKSEPQKLDATRDMQPETRLLKPENHNPIFHYSSIPGYMSPAKPIISDLAQRTRFSMLE